MRRQLCADVARGWRICFVVGFLFGLPALRLTGVYLALATFALAIAMPQLLKLGAFEHWTGGVQGLVITKPDAPFGLKISQDMWLYYFTLLSTRDLHLLGQLAEIAVGSRDDGDPRQRNRSLGDGRRCLALQDARVRRISAGITGVAGGLGAIAVQFVAPDGYTIQLAIALFLGMVVGGVGWLPGSLVGAAFIVFVPNIAEGVSKGLSGAVFGVILIIIIFVLPHGARQLAYGAQHLVSKLRR